MRPRSLSIATAGLVLLASTAATTAFAQADVDRATARRLGEAGAQALDAKDYKTAEADFRQADGIVHAPTLMLGLARALVGEGRFVEAQESYRRILREGVTPGSPPAFKKALEDAQQEVQPLDDRIGAVTITVKEPSGNVVPNAQVTWDGAPVNVATLGAPRPSDPGTHTLHVAADGYAAVDRKVDVLPGKTVEAAVSLQTSASAVPPPPVTTGAAAAASPTGSATPEPPPPAPAPGRRSPWPWVALGVGGAGLVVGGVAGVLAMSKRNGVVGGCPNGSCDPSARSDVDSFHTLATVSTVGFVVGGVFAAAGVGLLLFLPKESSVPTSGLYVTPVVGPSSIGAAGTF